MKNTKLPRDFILSNQAELKAKKSTYVVTKATTQRVVRRITKAPQKTYGTDDVLVLSARGSNALIKAIETPPEPSAKLLGAAELHRKLIKS
jgi:uncharacterized protein (DUF1778 family)